MLLLAETSATPLDTLYDMNNLPPPNGPHSMGQDTSMPPSGGYTNEAWANLSPYNQSPYGNSPMTDYGFPNYVHHPLPSESLSRMPPPPPQPQYHHQMIQPAPSPHIPHQPQQSHAHMGHHQLPMLNTNTTWPSQLTNPSPSAGSYSAPPPTTTPVSSATTIDHPPVPIREEKQRRSLSIEQKRQMCQYHEENPGVKQAEIGAKFGVERSTVSKVLGKKDEYLQRDTETEPGPKRAKSKNHSLERTLVNFAKKQQARGLEIKDEELMEKARHFARINPDDKESLLSTLTPTWLRKFKKENRIGSGRLMRRASETNIPDSTRREVTMARPAAGKGKSSRITSPVSAGGQMSPLSEGRSDEDMTTDAVDFDFSYSQPASHSTTSLTSDVRDTGRSSFSGTTMSPVGQFNFSPDPNTGAFQVDQNMHLHQDQQLDFHHREKRSNTFPSLNIDFMSQSVKADSSTPRIPPAMTAPSSAIDSPAGKELKPLLPTNSMAMGMDPVLASSPTLRRQGSNPSLSARSNLASGSNSAVQSVDSSPVSPSQEDARQAARTLLNYMNSMNTQQGAFDQLELMTVMQLTKKLHLHQPMATATMGPRGRGGLSRIPEGDGEGVAAEVAMETT